MSQLGNDTFTRTNVASGFGTATDGQSWTQIIPTGFAAGTVSVTSNEGVIVNGGTDTLMSLGPTSGDGEVLVRFSINNAGDTLGVQLRTQNVSGSVSNYKFLWYSGNVHLNKDVSNSNTQITTTAFAVTLNTFYWMRFRLVGTTSWGKIWADGSAEPAAWTATNTDSSVTGVGTASLLGNTGGGTGVRFDHFYAVDYPLQDTVTTSDSFSYSFAYVFTDSLTCSETNSETIAESVSDTALSCSDTLVYVTAGPSIVITDTVTSSDVLSDTLVSSLVDTSLTTADTIVAVLTVSYALLDVALSSSDTITGTGSTLVTAYNSGWTVLGNDTAIRSNVVGGWGTSTDGQTYSISLGSGTLALTSNELTLTASTTATYVRLGSNSSADAEILCRMSVNNTSSNGIGIFLRQTASNTSYRCRFNPSTPSQGFALGKIVAGTLTTIVTSTFTMSTSTFYYIRFRVQGTNLYGKFWASGSAEPAAWGLTTTDSSITGAGNFGIYDSASNTNNIASYDGLYCIDNALADNSIPPTPDTIVDSLVFVPTESQTIVESVTETDVFATVADIALSITQTALYTETFVGAEQTIPNLDNYIPGDALTYTNTAVGIIQVDQLTCSDASSFTQVFIPVETLTSTETISTTLATNIFFSWQETLTPSDTLVTTLAQLVSDTLSCSETATFLEILSLLDIGNSVSDSLLLTVSAILSDTASLTETNAEVIAFSWSDSALTTSDTLLSSRPVSFIDDTLTTSESLLLALTQLETWQGTLSDVKSSVEIFIPTDTISVTEIALYTEIFAKTDIALSLSDTLLSGVPSNFLADTLTVTESIVQTGSVPALLFTDQLIVSDNLFVLDNFTDSCFVVESYLTTVSSNILDPRSDLYATITSDAPTVYYQMTEGQFSGLFQRDGQDNVNNASNPTIIGAILSYTWAQIETAEGTYNWSIIDNDIIPWSNLGKSVIIRIHTASTIANNLVTHYGMTATQATPSWVFSAGAPMITGADSAVYPVYWDVIYQAKYATFITQLALRYDTNFYVRGVVASAGVNGSTSLERSGDTSSNTLLLWNPRGYTPSLWASAIHWVAGQYAMNFARTPILLSVDNAFIVPDTTFNINYCLDVAVQHAIWALDENASVNTPHSGQQWDIVPLMTIAAASTSVTGSTVALDLAVSINDQSDYAGVWEPDVTSPANQPTLTIYAAKATQRFFHDIAPLHKNVTVSGEVYPTSRILTGDYLNGAQQFDGASGYGMMTSAFQADTTKWTMKASVYPTVLPTQEAIFIANGQTGVAAYGGYAMGIAAGASGGAGQNLCAYIPGIGWYDSGYTFPAVNTWYTCFMVFDGTLLTFYVNGIQAPNISFIAPYPMQARATIGMIWDAVQLKQLKYFTGSIDEVAIYPTNLSGSRIAVISAAEMGLTDATTKATTLFTVQEIPLAVSDSASFITLSQSATDSLTVSDIFAQSSINVAYLGETILINDLFNRSNQAGWGVATDGQIWTQPTNNGTLSIVGNQGQITSMSGANVMFLGTNTAALVDGRIHITMQSGTDATVGIILRATDATHYYVARLNATNFGIVKVNGGSSTPLNDVAFTPSGGAGYWIRFRAVGSLLMAQYWIDTASEPSSFSSTATDSTFTTGQMGLYASTTTGADIYTFSNFFAVDNYLTDFIPVGEVYSTTEILPPFTDTVNETELTFIIESEVNLDITVTEVEVVVYNTIMLNTDVLSLATSVQAWSVSYIPTEILTINETLLSNSPTPLASDTLIITDASTVINQPVVVDTLSSTTDSIAEALVFVPVDMVTLQEILLDIELDFPVFDIVFSNEFPVYANANLLVDTVLSSDALAFSQIFVPIDQLIILDISTTTSIFALIDSAPTTSDSVSNTEVFMNTDVVFGDGTLDDSTTLYAITSSLVDSTLTTSDALLGSDVQNIVDVTLVTSDSIVPTAIPVLVDGVISLETIFLALTQTLSDTVSTSEILLSSSPANITDVTVVTSDSIVPTDIPVLVDTITSSDTLTSVGLSLLSDTVTTSDIITPTDIPVLIDAVSTSDTISDTLAVAFIDLNNQSTDYLFTPIMENTADPVLSATDLTIAIALNSNLIDVLTGQEILRTTSIFLLNDTSLLPGIEQITESLAVIFPVDSSLELESIFLTDIPQGLTDQILVSDILMAIVNPFIVDSLTTTEINSVQISVQFNESFNETEINIFALVTSFTGDQLVEAEILIASLLESDLSILSITDVSTTTGNAISNDLVSVISDVEVAGDIFVPIDPMTSLEILLTSEIYSATDTGTSSDTNNITTIMVPVDALLAQDLVLSDTTVEILIDTPTISDFSTMQNVFVPSDTITYSDVLTFALAYTAQDALIQVDASTTTVNNKNTDTLSSGVSAQSWIVIFVPSDTLSSIDASTTMVTQFRVDSLSVQDVVPTLGYGLLDKPLNSSEAISFSAKAYVLVTATIPSGVVHGIITNALVTGTIYSGEIQGVLT